ERMLDDDLAWARAKLAEGPLRPQVAGLVAAICLRQADQAALMAAVLPRLPVVERDALARRTFAALAEWLVERLRDEKGLRPELDDPEQLDRAVFVATRGLRWALNEAALEQPAWLRDPGFQREMARLIEGLWA
ncbi:MAG: hypothetical protein AAF602_26335, partial [Myxococcota bacterium]